MAKSASEQHALEQQRAAEQRRVIRAPDGKVDWSDEARTRGADVTTIIIGDDPHAQQKGAAIDGSAIPLDLATLFPQLTHLYVWGVAKLPALPVIPSSILCIDVRDCPDLQGLGLMGKSLPASLATLVLHRCAALELTPADVHGLAQLDDLSLRKIPVEDEVMRELLAGARTLRHLECTACTRLTRIASWPETLVDATLGECESLRELPAEWPSALRRIGLGGARSLTSLPTGTLSGGRPVLDHVDLANTASLRVAPPDFGTPRTLFLFGSGLRVRPEVLGTSATENVAADFLASLPEPNEGVVDELEVKVFLLGNGRAGKSSLARRWIKKDFDNDEKTTHGIRLWRCTLRIKPDGADRELDCTVNVWDFAGQDLYHNTHRLFLHSRAVYLICDTEHGDGADTASDKDDDDGLGEGEDTRYTVQYWRDQVTSLGISPGMKGSPPIAFVKTKCDRKDPPTRTIIGAEGLEMFPVSAQEGTGVEDLVKWIRQEAAKVVGDASQREMRKRMHDLKAFLRRSKMDANDAAHAAADEKSRGRTSEVIAKPPYPIMARSDFDELVNQFLPGSNYSKDPTLALDFLHRGGFLYYNKEYLPQHVVLDQRWATTAIYSVLRPHATAWSELRIARGRFVPSDLARWAWREAHYTEPQQRLFLSFMESCEICYRLREAYESNRPELEEEYIVPAALPREGEQIVQDELRWVFGEKPRFEPTMILGEQANELTRHDVVKLLVALGRMWRGAAIMWKWGGCIRTFAGRPDSPRSGGVSQGTPTFIQFSWTPKEAGGFFGTMKVRQIGPNAEFLGRFRNACEEVWGERNVRLGWPDARTDSSHAEQEQDRHDAVGDSLAEIALPALRIDAPRGLQQVPLEIGFTFAGKDGLDPPDNNRELWPEQLMKALAGGHYPSPKHSDKQAVEDGILAKVSCYRDAGAGDQARRTYAKQLVSRDFVVVVLSKKYLFSEACMYELYELCQRMGSGSDAVPKRDSTLCKVFSLPCGYLSESQSLNGKPELEEEVSTYWHNAVRTYMQNSRRAVHGGLLQRLASWFVRAIGLDHPSRSEPELETLRNAEQAWYFPLIRSFENPDTLKKLLSALKSAWGTERLSANAPSSAAVEQKALEIMRGNFDPPRLKRFAASAWKVSEGGSEGATPEETTKARERAVGLYLLAHDLTMVDSDEKKLVAFNTVDADQALSTSLEPLVAWAKSRLVSTEASVSAAAKNI